jgi:hypothetical protein
VTRGTSEPGRGDAPAEPVDSVRASAFAEAEGEGEAASAILLDPAAPAQAAVHHLRAAWRALGVDDDDARVLALDRTATDDRQALLRRARELSAAVQQLEQTLWGPQRRLDARRRTIRIAAMVALAFAPVLVWTAFDPPDVREGPWRGEYYATRDFTGEPILRRDGNIKFDWHEGGPTLDLPTDDFSIRWDTCMTIEEAVDYTFQLVSDDGSRLYVDGQLVVDNWGSHAERSRGGKIDLEPGVHHIRIEYFDAKADATVELAASVHGSRPTDVPTKNLTYPGDEVGDDPCAAAR